VPLETRVYLKLEELTDPVTTTTGNISLGGMYVHMPQPAPEGSLVAFEFRLGEVLVEGTGEVVWSRAANNGDDPSSGMGVRFRFLSPGSRERIFQ
jgi:uncharacterized protein (TIGR02266 family)